MPFLIRYILPIILVSLLTNCSSKVEPNTQPYIQNQAPISEKAMFAPLVEKPDGIPSPDPIDRDLFSLYKRLVLKDSIKINEALPLDVPPVKTGDVEFFWISDLDDNSVHQVRAELLFVSEHAYWYFEKKETAPQLEDVKAIAQTFESSIYPSVTSSFGNEWTPGIDRDPHIYILHVGLNGVSGYYSSSDEYPAHIYPYSNEHEIIYLDSYKIRLGSSQYFGLLAHELQHAIHWAQDPSEETWVNEGLSEVAKKIAGYPLTFVSSFEDHHSVSLIDWPADNSSPLPNYGASSLFMEYLAQRFGGHSTLKLLLQSKEDGINGVIEYLDDLGASSSFYEVFRDWTIVNYLDPLGIEGFHYEGLTINLSPDNVVRDYGQLSSTLPQFSAEYIELDFGQKSSTISFQASPTSSILPIHFAHDNHCWWGNKGDSIDSFLTTRADLSSVDNASLNFKIWYSLEKSWDYAYVELSLDDGASWLLLEGNYTSLENPLGRGFGPGYTGASKEWKQEKIDLSPYVGQKVLLRFEYVTDEARHSSGVCIDDISIPEINFFDDVENTNSPWLARGFIRINNIVKQDYLVHLVEVGEGVSVKHMLLDSSNRGSLVLRGDRTEVDRSFLVVSPVSVESTQPASYTITIKSLK